MKEQIFFVDGEAGEIVGKERQYSTNIIYADSIEPVTSKMINSLRVRVMWSDLTVRNSA